MTHDLLIFGWLHGLLSYQSSQDNNPLSGLWFQRFQNPVEECSPLGTIIPDTVEHIYIYRCETTVIRSSWDKRVKNPVSSSSHG